MHQTIDLAEARFLTSRYQAWRDFATEQRTAHTQLLEDYRAGTLPGRRPTMTFEQMTAEGDRLLATIREADAQANAFLEEAARALHMPTH
ncbi:hypothetical protein AB0O80_10525 [Rothia kristinae]|uniref:hypothetical protein n=1 Tax=Actinomycetes TaxID=1760 RepID=UPI0034454D1B